MPSETAVVYLARAAEGADNFKKFSDSYRKHPAGIPHELVVVWKGFPEISDIEELKVQCFGGLDALSIVLPDDGIDLTAYAHAASVLPHDNICFFNTFTEILAPNWLKYLSAALRRPGVGMVGGTASFESLHTSVKLVSKVIWLCQNNIPYDRDLYRQWKPLIRVHARRWAKHGKLRWRKERVLRWLMGTRRPRYSPVLDELFEEHWKKISALDGPVPYGHFPEFPNPHIRTNGFMMRREFYLECLSKAPAFTKNDSFAVESSKNGLPGQILQAGLEMLVVNDSGEAFPPDKWTISRTFRLGRQEGLLFADNHTRRFDSMNNEEKTAHTRMSWGNSIARAPAEHFDAGIQFLLDHPKFGRPSSFSTQAAFDKSMTTRIRDAFVAAEKEHFDDGPGVWDGIHETRKRDIRLALIGNDTRRLERILSFPGENNLFYGFENCFADFVKTAKAYPSSRREEDGRTIFTDLAKLASLLGARRHHNPEQPEGIGLPPPADSPEALIGEIEKVVGAKLRFPNPFPDEYGIQTEAGLVSFRAQQAIYQAWRLVCLSRSLGPRVLEIGAGLGRTAYYSRCFGATNYTIVDLPLTNVAQAAFLGTTLSPEQVCLEGEGKRNEAAVRIISPETLFRENEKFDVVVNADSLVEMPRAVAQRYAKFAKANSKALLSINHEAMEFSVRELDALKDIPSSRHLYPMRPGYLEEVYVFASDPCPVEFRSAQKARAVDQPYRRGECRETNEA